MLFGQFRRSDANDPEQFAATIAIHLAQFSREVIEYVTDPLTGLVNRCDFVPNVREVKQACVDHATHLRRVEEAKRRGPIMRSGPTKAPPMPKGRLSYAEATNCGDLRPIGRFEMVEDLKKKGLLDSKAADRVRETLGASRQQWSEIPNS